MAKKSDSEEEFSAGALTIKGNSLSIGNNVYQISNISVISVHDRSYNRSVPAHVVILAVACAALGVWSKQLRSDESIFIGVCSILAGIAAVISFIVYSSNSKVSLAAIYITMNSANRLILLISSFDIAKALTLALRSAMTDKSPRNITFNNIGDRTFIDNVTGSTIALGDVYGDIANNTKA